MASMLKGKIVICEVGNINNTAMADDVKNAGDAAMILMNFNILGFTTPLEVHNLPVSYVSDKDSIQIKKHFATNSTPTAKITFGGTVFGARPAPALARFSSRGPAK